MEHNLSIIQRIESSSADCNIFIPAKLFIDNNSNNFEFCSKAMIKTNRYLLKSVTAISKYMKTFDFGENRFIVQI